MIQASELKIGNWVKHKEHSEIVRVRGVITNEDNKTMVYVFGQINDLSENFDPILITDKILERAGFEISEGEVTGTIHYSNGLIKLIVRAGAYCFYSFSYTSFHYVHQLQNLYSTFTNEELLPPVK